MSEHLASLEELRYAYRLLLLREPDVDGFEHFARKIQADGLTTRQLVGEFVGSAEFAKLHELLQPVTALEQSPRLSWQPCTHSSLSSANFRHWAATLRERQPRPHRKIWEWCYIAQALYERGYLVDGNRGLGFAVGTEPLVALFASMGCRIIATDLDFTSASKGGWTKTHEHAENIGILNERGICRAEKFAANASFATVDMCNIPSDLGGFDFIWSSCAIEHLGSIDAAAVFVRSAMRCLKSGGVAVHTTEFNCDSETETITHGKDVILRTADFKGLRAMLASDGHDVGEIDFTLGESEEDRYVDEAPFKGPSHLKLRIGGFASTSFGMIIRKN